MSISNLNSLSEVVISFEERAEEDRKEFEKSLGEPFLFAQHPDDIDGHGIGYFRVDKNIIMAYRRLSNGYERYPCGVYGRNLIEKMYAELNP